MTPSGRGIFSIRFRAMSRYSVLRSRPAPRLPRDCATATVVPLPTKGSRTVAGQEGASWSQVGAQPVVRA